MGTWRNAYIWQKLGEDSDMAVKKLHAKKKCHSYLLGQELDKQVRAYLSSLQDHGAAVTQQ